jgi:Phytanoyl-CoA dioxygenase (PhyH)
LALNATQETVDNTKAVSSRIESEGFEMIPEVLSAEACRSLVTQLGPVSGAGRRHLLTLPCISSLAKSEQLVHRIRPHLPAQPRAVRAIYFDKSSEANWLVPWHQDLTLAVRQRADTPGFDAWSLKDGVPHVQPPVALLEQMLTVRLHLDDADRTNGALRVLPGSHRHGRLSAEQIRRCRDATSEVLCCTTAGDALLMRPLLLHASSRSTQPTHRRILHLEYASFSLPAGLDWHEMA